MKKGGKKDLTVLAMNVGKAGAGGILAEVVADYIAKNSPEMIENNPKITEIIPIAGGVGILYFMGDEWSPLAYGMIGAGASGFADDLMQGLQGFNRVQYMNGATSDELSKGIRFIEEMQGVAFDDAEILDSHCFIVDDDKDAMSGDY